MVQDITSSQNKTMFRGDDITFEITVKDVNSVAVDITGGTMVFSAKENANETTALITKTSATASEITFTDATNGVAQIYLVPADTRDLKAQDYLYDVQFTQASGTKHTLLKAKLTLFDDVTQT